MAIAALTEDELIGLPESELVRRTWEVVDSLAAECEDDRFVSELDGLLTEMFERWAPAAEWEDHVRRAFELDGAHTERAWVELDAVRESMRGRAGARRVRDLFDDGRPHLTVIMGGRA